MGGYFEGWYFKQQSERDMIAFIPAMHTDRDGKKTCSLQVVTPDKAYWLVLPGEEFAVDRRTLTIKAGDNLFSSGGLRLSIHQGYIDITGRLAFDAITPPAGDIMGPYRYVPFMECRHSIFSLTHAVSGSLTVNGRLMDFSEGSGYIEGDRGRSFPKRYVWTQCNWDAGGPCSLMLSVADVRPFGVPFVGIIGFVYFGGREHRIATYCGATLVSAGGGAVSIRQGDYTLTAQLLEDGTASAVQRTQSLRAPVSGEMDRRIKESLACRARYTFAIKECVLFDIISDKASFEYEFR